MMDSADRVAVQVAKDAAARIKIHGNQDERAVAKQLSLLLGRSRRASSRNLTDLDRRDSEDLAQMAAGQRLRAGERQSILLLGMFIMWVADRTALNTAFESVPSAQEWLRPFPPEIAMVGEGSSNNDTSDFEKSVVRRAEANNGPVDKWYRGFRIEK